MGRAFFARRFDTENVPPNSASHRAAEVSRLTATESGLAPDGSSSPSLSSELDAVSEEFLADPRRDGRVSLGVPARAQADHTDVVGSLKNVSISGALLVTRCSTLPPVGTGLEVAFRLPTGPQLRLASTVRWNRDDDPKGDFCCGLQFMNVSGPNRSYLDHYVELTASTAGEESLRAEVQCKYRLTFDAAGRAQAMLGGMLTREEAQAFATLLKQRLATRRNPRMHFAFDVRRLSVCNQDVLLELKRCFELFAQRPDVFGFLIGNKSLALTQLVRAARDAGIADHVFCVNEPEDACRIWDQMEG